MQAKKKLILTLTVISLLSISASMLYYRADNQKVDPRTLEARSLYQRYQEYASSNNFIKVFQCLDSIESTYEQIAYYHLHSYEKGITKNNRAAALITLALFRDSLPTEKIPAHYLSLDAEALFEQALLEICDALHLYENWKLTYKELKIEEIPKESIELFFVGLENYSTKKKEQFWRKRTEDIKEAQLEIDRRISVALTNYGVCLRHQKDYAGAAEYYVRAMDHWPDNLQAKNNLNVLLNQPQEKRGVIDKLFPQERIKKEEQ